jgi:hypothetical protein
MAQMVECLTSKCEAPSSNPSITNRKDIIFTGSKCTVHEIKYIHIVLLSSPPLPRTFQTEA